MHADDTVLVAESAEMLQKLLDGLLIWTEDYGLKVNVQKQKSWCLGRLVKWEMNSFIIMETV